MNYSINNSHDTRNDASLDMSQNKVMPSRQRQSLIERLEGIVSLSQLLRFIGAVGVLASMSLFMLKGWSEGNDISRYLKLLAQTGLLTGAGLILSFVVKEVKGARVFFGLGLASVVANFTILGALTYSLFPIDSQLMDYPSMIRWEVATLTTFIPTFFGALVLLSIVAYFGFSVFARKFSKPMTLGFLALSAMLLIPLRAPIAAAGLSALALAGAWILIQRCRNNEAFLSTFETKVAMSLLLLPGAIIGVRALSFYNLDSYSLLAFMSLGFAIVRTLAITLELSILSARILAGIQFIFGIVIAFLLAHTLPTLFNLYNYGYEAIIMSVAIVGFALEQVINGKDNVWKEWLTTAVTLVLVPLSVLGVLSEHAFSGSHALQTLIITALVLALNIITSKTAHKPKFSYALAICGFGASVIISVINIVELVQLSNWVIIGLIGATFIVGASMYERYGLRLGRDQNTDDHS